MNDQIEEKVEAYLQLLDRVKERVSNEATAASIVTEIAKDRRVNRMQQNNGTNGSPATEKQKKYMSNLGIDYPENVTKKEASKLIDEELGQDGEQ